MILKILRKTQRALFILLKNVEHKMIGAGTMDEFMEMEDTRKVLKNKIRQLIPVNGLPGG